MPVPKKDKALDEAIKFMLPDDTLVWRADPKESHAFQYRVKRYGRDAGHELVTVLVKETGKAYIINTGEAKERCYCRGSRKRKL